jgi:hypothetical protein
MIYRHYGSSKFEPKKFRPIINRDFVKPYGELWASPVDSNYGWKQWCTAAEFAVLSLERSFDFQLAADARVFQIDSRADLLKLSLLESLGFIAVPDFETIMKTWDVLFLTDEGQAATRFSQPSLCGWDCECILVLNPECVVPKEL